MIGQIFALIKTLLMRDADPSELNKPWWQRRRTVQKIIAAIGFVLYYKWGLVLDNDMKDMLWDNYQVIISSVQALVVAFVALWGVIGTVVGHVGYTGKVIKKVTECEQNAITVNTVNVELPESPKNP